MNLLFDWNHFFRRKVLEYFEVDDIQFEGFIVGYIYFVDFALLLVDSVVEFRLADKKFVAFDED
jgi:hypothetical protein